MEARIVARLRTKIDGWIRSILDDYGTSVPMTVHSLLEPSFAEVTEQLVAAVERVGEQLEDARNERKQAAAMEARTRRLLASVAEVASQPGDGAHSEDGGETGQPVRMPWEGAPDAGSDVSQPRPWEPG